MSKNQRKRKMIDGDRKRGDSGKENKCQVKRQRSDHHRER